MTMGVLGLMFIIGAAVSMAIPVGSGLTLFLMENSKWYRNQILEMSQTYVKQIVGDMDEEET